MMQKRGPTLQLSDGTGDALVDARLAAIVESSFDAIVSKDLDGIIASWNPAAERLFGYSAEEAVGQSILIIIPDSHRQEEEGIIQRIRRGERVPTFETIRRRKDGSQFPVSITVSPIRTASGRIIGASKIARDISASKENEGRIRLLLREVNHRVKNQYAVILSMVRETLRHSDSSAEFERKVRQRIMALSRSHDLLVAAEWKGAPLEELLNQQLESFGGGEGITISGPPILASPTAVQNLGMAFHELATNSARSGVLARGGTINVAWRIEGAGSEKTFHLDWVEIFAEPDLVVDDTDRRGFGNVVLRRVVPQSLMGSTHYEFAGDRVTWTLVAPLKAVVDTDLDEQQ